MLTGAAKMGLICALTTSVILVTYSKLYPAIVCNFAFGAVALALVADI